MQPIWIKILWRELLSECEIIISDQHVNIVWNELVINHFFG